MGLVAAADGNPEGLSAIAIYILVYAFMNLGAFAVIIVMRRGNLIGDEIDDLSGLMTRAPGLAILMLIFLLSLAGIPPTAGFIGKYFIFLALIETQHYTLAVLGVAYAVVALYYYFRIVVAMFMKKAPESVPLAMSSGISVALVVSLGFTLAAGIYPEPFIRLAREAIRPRGARERRIRIDQRARAVPVREPNGLPRELRARIGGHGLVADLDQPQTLPEPMLEASQHRLRTDRFRSSYRVFVGQRERGEHRRVRRQHRLRDRGVGLLPFDRLRFPRMRFAGPLHHTEEIQPHSSVRIRVDARDPWIRAYHVDAELLVQFAR